MLLNHLNFVIELNPLRPFLFDVAFLKLLKRCLKFANIPHQDQVLQESYFIRRGELHCRIILCRIGSETVLINPFNVKQLLRPAIFVPESKRLNVLLKEFRSSRNHMAIVVDEYGGVAGMVTIEDVIEQIVGEIEDEHDVEEEDTIRKHSEAHYTIKALTPIEDFNEYFETTLSDEEFDTIGGLVVHEIGHLPKRGERIVIGNLLFKILRADNRRVHMLQLTVLPRPIEQDSGQLKAQL